jgi:hypothetical protein
VRAGWKGDRRREAKVLVRDQRIGASLETYTSTASEPARGQQLSYCSQLLKLHGGAWRSILLDIIENHCCAAWMQQGAT